MKGFNVPERFQDFLKSKDILDADAFALLATEEKEVQSEILDWAKGGGVQVSEKADIVAVKKLWIACRKGMGEAAPNATAQAASEEAQVWVLGALVEKHAKAALDALAPPDYQTVVNRGSLASARCPTAALMARVRKCSHDRSRSPAQGRSHEATVAVVVPAQTTALPQASSATPSTPPGLVPPPPDLPASVDDRVRLLQGRLTNGAGGFPTLSNAHFPQFKFHVKPGASRHDDFWLDGGWQGCRVAYSEAQLTLQPSPPHTIATASIIYQIAVPKHVCDGKIRSRGEWHGAGDHFLKAGCLIGKSWIEKGYKHGIDLESWCVRAVCFSYQHRLESKTCNFWRRIMSGVMKSASPSGQVPWENLKDFVVKAKFVMRDDAAVRESELGCALGAAPNVVCLQNTTKWASKAHDSNHFFHFIGPAIEPVGPLAEP